MKNFQSLYSHALYFDPINQQRVPSGTGKLHYSSFKDVPGFTPFEDGSFEVTYFASDAKKVQIRGIGGSMPNTYDMEKSEEMPGYFKVVISDVCPGFHYVEFLVDGVNAIHPNLPIGYGCSVAINFLDVPDPEFTYCELRDVPHGSIHTEIYYSDVTKRYRNCLVYTPASYRTSNEKRYPVFYVQHGGGENETGWIWQGKINYILDNMIAEGKCEEMIVVLNCGYNFQQKENGEFTIEDIGDVICKDCVPMIDERYRTKALKEYRAMAGLSFGSYHSKITVLSNTDVFSSLGVWSGGIGYTSVNSATLFSGLAPYDFTHIFESKESFNSHLKLLYIGYGDEEEAFVKANTQPAADLISKEYNVVHQTFPGFHEWNVWRRCAFEMCKLLFKW